MLLTLQHGVHKPCSWPFLKMLQRRHPAAPLMGYYHTQARNWVVARWACKYRGVVDELFIADSPQGFTVEDAADAAFMLDKRRLGTYKRWAQEQVAAKQRWERADDTHRQQLHDIRSFLQKKLPGVQKEDPNVLTELALASEPTDVS